MHTLKKSIYSFLCTDHCMEAMMNIMQAAFATLQSVPKLDGNILSNGCQIFKTLFRFYFTDTMEVSIAIVDKNIDWKILKQSLTNVATPDSLCFLIAQAPWQLSWFKRSDR